MQRFQSWIYKNWRHAIFVSDFEDWREHTRPFYDVRLKTAADKFKAMTEYSKAGRLIITNVEFTPLLFDHNPATLKGFEQEYLLFERYSSGMGRGTLNETATKVDADNLHLVDLTQRYITSTTNVSGIGVLIPHDLIGFDPSRDKSYTTLPSKKPRGRLISQAFDALEAAIAEDNMDESTDMANAFAGLIQRLMLGRDQESDLQSADATTDLALRDYIDANLASPNLDAEHLCDRFGLSRASLYRRFRDDGGIDRYIVGRRLDRSFSELCALPPARGRIKEIAGRWGYADPGNFNRRFRERFGLSPSECMAHKTTQPFSSQDAGNAYVIQHLMRRNQQ